jgi:cytosine/adenosine deaminase-related metal-dependent hydrolase
MYLSFSCSFLASPVYQIPYLQVVHFIVPSPRRDHPLPRRDDSITPLQNTDLLIEENLIKAIGCNLPVSDKTRVIDCTNNIISPGFIDTHHHLWQSQLKGRFNDDTFLEYMPKGKGKKADVVVFDAGTPSMLCATEQDPVVAVLRFSDVRDIDMVMVDGVIRKEGGKLTDVDAEG